MRKEIKTIISYILIFIVAITTSTTEVYAGVNVNTSSAGGGRSGGGGTCTRGTIGTVYDRDIFDKYFYEELYLTEDIYDKANNYLGESLLIQNNLTFKAGTFVGIDAYEKYKYKVTIGVVSTCANIDVSCQTYGWDECFAGKWKNPLTGKEVIVTEPCLVKGPIVTRDVSCDGEYEEFLNCVYNPCDPKDWEEYADEAARVAQSYIDAADLSPTYDAYIQDVNDINKGVDPVTKDPAIGPDNPDPKGVKYTGVYDISDPERVTLSRIEGEVSKTATFKYSYNLLKACVNKKTGMVTYRGVSSKGIVIDEPCEKDEIEVEELTTKVTPGNEFVGLHVGQYFIPLNTKETDELRYDLKPNSSRRTPISPGLCLELIKNYNEIRPDREYWRDFLYDSNKKSFSKTPYATVVQSVTKNGCYMGYQTKLRVKQAFYNEDNKDNLSGYKFYYRPIDYTKPFPNGLSADSFWVPVYNENNNTVIVDYHDGDNTHVTKTYRLNNSFEKETYRTNDNYNVHVIRDYNDKYYYTSWADMKGNGKSEFIDDGNNGITRENCGSVYTLGCGPANATWEECKGSKGITEVCK